MRERGKKKDKVTKLCEPINSEHRLLLCFVIAITSHRHREVSVEAKVLHCISRDFSPALNKYRSHKNIDKHILAVICVTLCENKVMETFKNFIKFSWCRIMIE